MCIRDSAMSLLGCLEEGKMDEYARIARDLPPSPLSIFFEELPWLKGNAEILYRASRLLKGVEEAIEPLKSIYAELVKMGYGDCIVIDLSLVRELDYYSGPIFDVYFEDTGIPIGGGGRYDTLLERHGMLGQAVGFALDLEVLALNTTKPTTEAQKILLWAQEMCIRDRAYSAGFMLVVMFIGVVIFNRVERTFIDTV